MFSMNAGGATTIILEQIETFGLAMLGALSTFVIVGVGFLVFREGKKFLLDQSYSIGGYYLRKTPYRGYRRFRSQKWNSEHMP